jgi:hypothetical protein
LPLVERDQNAPRWRGSDASRPATKARRDQLVHQALGVDPAQGVPADPEPAGVVGDDDGAFEQALLADAPPERALGGELDRVGRHREPGEAERLQVRLPARSIGEAPGRVRGQPVDHRPREAVRAHVREGVVVDDVLVVTGAQDLQEVPPALREAGGEEGEAVVADLRRHPVARPVAGAGVVDGEPARRRQAGAQHHRGLVVNQRRIGTRVQRAIGTHTWGRGWMAGSRAPGV